MIGYKEGEKIGRVRRFISRYCTIVFLRIILFCSGMVWISYERPVVDWRNLLGSDFKPVYEGISQFYRRPAFYPNVSGTRHCL